MANPILSCGLIIVWTSPLLEILKTNNTETNPLGAPISIYEQSWITSLFSIGLAIGPLLLGMLPDLLGRKLSQILLSLIVVVTFFILAFTKHIVFYYITRFIQGLCVGFFITTIPLYIGEITEDTNRGQFGTFTSLFATLGNLTGYILPAIFPMRIFTLLFSVPSIFGVLLLMFFVPESPIYLTMNKRRKDTEAALVKFRNVDSIEARRYAYQIEEMLQQTTTNQNPLNLSRLAEIRNIVYIGLGVSVVHSIAGMFAILGYFHSIFSGSELPLSGNISSIIIGLVQVVMICLCSVVIEKWGRRVLMLVSSTTTVISFFLLGTYFKLQQLNISLLPFLSWLPIISVTIYITGYTLGVGTVCFVIMSEIFPADLKSLAVSISMVPTGLFDFLLTFSFPVCSEFLGMAWYFWIMGVINIFGLIYVFFFIPETQGKNFLEIQKILRT